MFLCIFNTHPPTQKITIRHLNYFKTLSWAACLQPLYLSLNDTKLLDCLILPQNLTLILQNQCILEFSRM